MDYEKTSNIHILELSNRLKGSRNAKQGNTKV